MEVKLIFKASERQSSFNSTTFRKDGIMYCYLGKDFVNWIQVNADKVAPEGMDYFMGEILLMVSGAMFPRQALDMYEKEIGTDTDDKKIEVVVNSLKYAIMPTEPMKIFADTFGFDLPPKYDLDEAIKELEIEFSMEEAKKVQYIN